MKYQSSNILKDFEFHDALFALESYDNHVLTVVVRHLNIHKTAVLNPHLTDMEIISAKITFNNFQVISYEPGRMWKKTNYDEFYTDEPQVIYEGKIAEEKLLNELRSGTTILEFGTLENSHHYFDGAGNEPWFQAQFIFDSATIEWDEFRKPAWYEEQR